MFHHSDSLHNLLLVFPEKFESQEKHQSEMLENIRILALHKFDIVCSQFEGGSFEIHIARRAWEHEAEIDMNDVSNSVNQDIVIMSILDLKQILDQWIASKALNKISDRLFPILPINLLIYFP